MEKISSGQLLCVALIQWAGFNRPAHTPAVRQMHKCNDHRSYLGPSIDTGPPTATHNTRPYPHQARLNDTKKTRLSCGLNTLSPHTTANKHLLIWFFADTHSPHDYSHQITPQSSWLTLTITLPKHSSFVWHACQPVSLAVPYLSQ